MRKALLIAALMMSASVGTAYAGDSWSFMVNGQRVKIERPHNCTSLSCINIVAPGLTNSGSDDDSSSSTTSNAPAQTTQPVASAPVQQAPAQQVQQPVQPQVATAPVTQAPATPPVATIPPLPGQTTTSANVTTLPAPTSNETNTAAATSVPALPQVTQPVQQIQQPVQQQVAAVAPTAPAQTVAPAPVANGPVGFWMTEKNEGKVHVVNCGADICGYAVEKNGADGAQVLINMKPEGDSWHGRIHDTRGGSTYDSTIAMRGNDKMRVQGCAFGGMFCGGQTWTRAN